MNTGKPPVKHWCQYKQRPCEYANNWGKCLMTACVKHGDESLIYTTTTDKLDCISRQDAINAVENTNIKITESEWDELINAIDNLPPVTLIAKTQQADTLIIADALRSFSLDCGRHVSDRERAGELRGQVLAYGASMCQPKRKKENDNE